jgi:hypothetical protein
MANTTNRTARKVADMTAIVAGLMAMGNAMWGPMIFGARTLQERQGDPGLGYNWVALGVGGLLAIIGVTVAQRRTTLGRILVAVGGVMLVAVPLAYRLPAALPVTTSVILGVLLLVATPFVGEMPAPRGMPQGNAGTR